MWMDRILFRYKKYRIPDICKKNFLLLFSYNFVLIWKSVNCSLFTASLNVLLILVIIFFKESKIFLFSKIIFFSNILMFPFITCLEETAHGGVIIGKGKGNSLENLIIGYQTIFNVPLIFNHAGISFQTCELKKKDILEILCGGPIFTIITSFLLLIFTHSDKLYFAFLLIPTLSMAPLKVLNTDGSKIYRIFKETKPSKLLMLLWIIESNILIIKSFFLIFSKKGNETCQSTKH